MKISTHGRYFAGTIGMLIASITFFARDLFAVTNFQIYEKNPIVNVAGMNGAIEQYIVGISFMALYVFIGILIGIVSAELFIRVCDFLDFRPRIYYFFLSPKYKDCDDYKGYKEREKKNEEIHQLKRDFYGH